MSRVSSYLGRWEKLPKPLINSSGRGGKSLNGIHQEDFFFLLSQMTVVNHLFAAVPLLSKREKKGGSPDIIRVVVLRARTWSFSQTHFVSEFYLFETITRMVIFFSLEEKKRKEKWFVFIPFRWPRGRDLTWPSVAAYCFRDQQLCVRESNHDSPTSSDRLPIC